LVVPGNDKYIPIGNSRRLRRSKALSHDGMLLVEDQVFEVNLWPGISNPSAHDFLDAKSDVYDSLLEFARTASTTVDAAGSP